VTNLPLTSDLGCRLPSEIDMQNKTEIIVKAIANKGRCLTADGIRQRTCDAALMISLLLESLRSGTGFHKEGQ